MPQDELTADDIDFPKIHIDERRDLIIRTFLGDLPLGVDDIEESLRDAVETSDIQ